MNNNLISSIKDDRNMNYYFFNNHSNRQLKMIELYIQIFN
jgi:hypothetical protein